MKLLSQNYGKQRVRVMKVLRTGDRHDVKEIEVGVRLDGEFTAAYTDANNASVVPTDTMKNTVLALAHEHLGRETERFVLRLGEHFLAQYAHVTSVAIDSKERRWTRMARDGKAHPHSFIGEEGRALVHLTARRGAPARLESGLEELSIMKSTASGFAGYPKDRYTTLPETTDRVLATRLSARWLYRELPADFNDAHAAVLAEMLRVFAETYSPSVQATLFEMAGAALRICPEMEQITIAMPNRHYLTANLAPFGLNASGVTFIPTEEPHGQIEATVARG